MIAIFIRASKMIGFGDGRRGRATGSIQEAIDFWSSLKKILLRKLILRPFAIISRVWSLAPLLPSSILGFGALFIGRISVKEFEQLVTSKFLLHLLLVWM